MYSLPKDLSLAVPVGAGPGQGWDLLRERQVKINWESDLCPVHVN